MNRYNFTLPSGSVVASVGQVRTSEVAKALTEAWNWLEREGCWHQPWQFGPRLGLYHQAR